MRSSPSAVQVRDDFRDFLLTMAAEYSRFPSLRPQESSLTELAASLVNPFTLAVIGYMKTGKSSLINALIGKPLAITGTDEATATLNWIVYGDEHQEKDFLVHWKDRHPETMPVATLKQWAGKSPEVLQLIGQISHLQLFACSDLIKDIDIVDTPGVGTVAQAHTEAATTIISKEAGKKADALLYVFPPVAKASDIEKLQALKNSRLPGSEPYNSIGVLHLWDGLEGPDPFAEATRKAETLHTGTQHGKKIHDGLEDLVCDIIPVSAPLALAARYAPDEFFEHLIALLKNGYSSDWLLASELWDEDSERCHIRKLHSDMPWVSFTLMVRTLIGKTPASVSESRYICLEASGIERLEKELDRRFFLNAAVIKQRLTRVKAIDPINRGVLFFNERIEMLKNDVKHFRDLAAELPKSSKHAHWLKDKHSRMEQESTELDEIADKANRIQLAEEDRMNLLEMDLGFLEQMDKNPGFVEEADADQIRKILRQECFNGALAIIPPEILKAMIGRYQHQLQGPIKRTRGLFEHLIRRIHERLREGRFQIVSE